MLALPQLSLASGMAGSLMTSRKGPGLKLWCIAALLVAAMAWTGGGWAQTVYKWVDRNGVTQYSSSPPPAGASGVVVPVPPPPSAEAASQAKAAAQRASDEAKRLEAERLREQADTQFKDDAARRSAAGRLQRCAKAREQLDLLMKPAPVYRHNERGERIYLEDSARDAEIARLRSEVAMYCSSADEMQKLQDAATRQQATSAAQRAKCNEAREQLRDLQADPSRLAAADIEDAQRRVRLLCGGGP
jgi:Domain of unknown function (DUF4124)